MQTSTDGKHTFSLLPPTPGLLLSGGRQGIREHRGTVDADVIKVGLLQEVLFALEEKNRSAGAAGGCGSAGGTSAEQEKVTYRGRFLLLPALARL